MNASPRQRPRRGRCALVATLHDALTAAPTITVSTSGNNGNNSPLLEQPASSGADHMKHQRRLLSSPTMKSPREVSPTRRRENTAAATTPSIIDEPMDEDDDRRNSRDSARNVIRIQRLRKLPSMSKKRSPITQKLSNMAPNFIHKATFKSKTQSTKASTIVVLKNTSSVRTADRVMGVTTKTTTAAINHIVTDDSSFSDTNNNNNSNSHKNSRYRALTVPSSKFPKRIRIPTNFYHVTSTTTTTATPSVPFTRASNRNNHNKKETKNEHEALSMLAIRPQRKRNPTEFFTPSDFESVVYQSQTNPTREMRQPQPHSASIPSKSMSLGNAVESKGMEQDDALVLPRITRDKLAITNVRERNGALFSQCNATPSGHLSYENLLIGYQEHVTLGNCHPISFGKTLSTARLAIERKIQSLKRLKQYKRDCYSFDDDKEIVADVREYKRSLRAFSVYEDREKLASIQEVQERLEFWGRHYATMTVHPKRYKTFDTKFDNNCRTNGRWMELSLLEKRPIVISSGSRMMSRSAFKCSNGRNCIFGCQRKTIYDTDTTANVFADNTVVTPIPLIKPFDVDDDDIDDTTSPPNTTTRRTIDTLRELQSSLLFIAAYQDKTTYFSSTE